MPEGASPKPKPFGGSKAPFGGGKPGQPDDGSNGPQEA